MNARRLGGARRVLAMMAVFGVTMIPAPMQAHHGWGGYANEEFEISGIVEQTVSFAGAHATMKLRVGTQLWDLTLAPPLRVTQAGLSETTIPVGATITAHGHRSKDKRRFEVKTERVSHNGKTYNVYPDRD